MCHVIDEISRRDANIVYIKPQVGELLFVLKQMINDFDECSGTNR